MKILFIGHEYSGSNARSLREALTRLLPGSVDDIGIDLIVSNWRTPVLRLANRVLRPLQETELERTVLRRVEDFRPDFVVVFKGTFIKPTLVRTIKAAGPKTVLVFPDYSPHAYGDDLQNAVGEYDLICTTKPFHPALWKSVYGYDNRCVFIPHGYDPLLHFSDKPAERHEFDVVFLGNGRPEYHQLMQELADRIAGHGIRVAVAGPNWTAKQVNLPPDWTRSGDKFGLTYRDWLRKGKIAVAPLNTKVVIKGVVQPGDVDTARTYQIPAANCFCLHRRTDFVKAVFDEETEMPMFDDAAELAEKILFYLSRDELRRSVAIAAHMRAVPAYSLDNRAAQIVACLNDM